MISTLPEKFDAKRLWDEYVSFGVKTRGVHISSPDGSIYDVGSGNIYTYDEQDQNKWTTLNKMFRGTYLEEVYNTVDQKYHVCRARFMLMTPEYRAYSYHFDQSKRLHIPIKTNRDCMFLINDTVYRMPEEGRLYLMDTIQMHTALNLSWENRLHIVFCVRNDEAN